MARTAIVTGGGSGIGAALSRALAGRGDHVVIADIDAEAAEKVAADIGGTSAPLDVRDAEAVDRLVQDTAAAHGRLDLIVNNAGIGVGGPVEELTVAHWDRVIDVNLRGVVHGVQAAYPLMQRQGGGHIVNIGSLAGLIPGPYLTPYVAAKHAVVGMSLSLRAEGAPHGVRVTVVCPGFTDTPILDKGGPEDLPRSALADHTREFAVAVQRRLYSPEALAGDIVRGIDRNAAIVVAPASARIAWGLHRLSPRLFAAVATRQAARYRRKFDLPLP